MVQFPFNPEDYMEGARPRVVRGSGPLANGHDLEPSTQQAMKAVRRWLIWKSVPVSGKKNAKHPYYADGTIRRGPLDGPEDSARLVSYTEARAALTGRDATWGLGFALGPDDTGRHWQGVDFDNRMDGIEKAPGYVEHSPSNTGYHVIGRGKPFPAYNKDGIEAYSFGRFFTFTEKIVSDGPLIDLLDTKLRDMVRPTVSVSNAGNTSAILLKQYIDAGNIPDGDCDNALTSFHGHAAWAVARGYASQLEAAAFLGRVNNRLAANKDKDFGGKFKRMLEKEGLQPSDDFRKYEEFDDGIPLRLFGPKLDDEDEAVTYDPDQPEFSLYAFDRFIGRGTTIVSGATSVGKSTFLTTILLLVAHLTRDSTLHPEVRRKVVVVTEDTARFKRTIRGLTMLNDLVSVAEVKEWFFIFRAARRTPDQVAERVAHWVAKFAVQQRNPQTGTLFDVPPIIFLDTLSSNFVMKDENSASEAGDMIFSLTKRLTQETPILISHHLAKTEWSKEDPVAGRGSGGLDSNADGSITAVRMEERTKTGLISWKHRVDVPNDVLSAAPESIADSGYTHEGFPREENYLVFRPKDLQYSTQATKKAADAGRKESRKELSAAEEIVKIDQRLKDLMSEALSTQYTGLAFKLGKGGPRKSPPLGYLRKSIRFDALQGIDNTKSELVEERLNRLFSCREEEAFLLCTGEPHPVGSKSKDD